MLLLSVVVAAVVAVAAVSVVVDVVVAKICKKDVFCGIVVLVSFVVSDISTAFLQQSLVDVAFVAFFVGDNILPFSVFQLFGMVPSAACNYTSLYKAVKNTNKSNSQRIH